MYHVPHVGTTSASEKLHKDGSMRKVQIAIWNIILVAGIYLGGYAAVRHAEPIAVWSDSKALAARFAADPAARYVWAYGNEKERPDSDDILNRV